MIKTFIFRSKSFWRILHFKQDNNLQYQKKITQSRILLVFFLPGQTFSTLDLSCAFTSDEIYRQLLQVLLWVCKWLLWVCRLLQVCQTLKDDMLIILNYIRKVCRQIQMTSQPIDEGIYQKNVLVCFQFFIVHHLCRILHRFVSQTTGVAVS